MKTEKKMKLIFKYCKKTGLPIDDLFIISQKVVFNHRRSIMKYIYKRERLNHPQKLCKEIKQEMMDKFNISKSLLEKLLHKK